MSVTSDQMVKLTKEILSELEKPTKETDVHAFQEMLIPHVKKLQETVKKSGSTIDNMVRNIREMQFEAKQVKNNAPTLLRYISEAETKAKEIAKDKKIKKLERTQQKKILVSLSKIQKLLTEERKWAPMAVNLAKPLAGKG